jgi:hypothetical protein
VIAIEEKNGGEATVLYTYILFTLRIMVIFPTLKKANIVPSGLYQHGFKIAHGSEKNRKSLDLDGYPNQSKFNS